MKNGSPKFNLADVDLSKIEEKVLAGLVSEPGKILGYFPQETAPMPESPHFWKQKVDSYCLDHDIHLNTKQKLIVDMISQFLTSGEGKSFLIELLYNVEKTTAPVWHLPEPPFTGQEDYPTDDPELADADAGHGEHPIQASEGHSGYSGSLLKDLQQIMSSKTGQAIELLGIDEYTHISTGLLADQYNSINHLDIQKFVTEALKSKAKNLKDAETATKPIQDAVFENMPENSVAFIEDDDAVLCCMCNTIIYAENIFIEQQSNKLSQPWVTDSDGNHFHPECYQKFVSVQLKKGAQFNNQADLEAMGIVSCPYNQPLHYSDEGCPVCHNPDVKAKLDKKKGESSK